MAGKMAGKMTHGQGENVGNNQHLTLKNGCPDRLEIPKSGIPWKYPGSYHKKKYILKGQSA
jgi:hypothetical protein